MTQQPGSRGKLAPEFAATLAYLGGVITGIVMLVLEKDDRFVRFHAKQSIVTFLLVVVAQFLLTGLPVLGRALYLPFLLGVGLLWVFLMVQAFQGRRYKLPYIGDFVEHQLR